MEKKIRILLTICGLAIIFMVTFHLVSILDPRGQVHINSLEPNRTFLDSPRMPVSHSFAFRNSTLTLSTAVNSSVYHGAKDADKTIYSHAGVPYITAAGTSARFMIQDPAQDELFHDLISQFRKIRYEYNLTDDEYVELIAAYVQSIEYYTTEEQLAKYPVETVFDRKGDCDDKSMLLAGLLSREGYNVSLILFEKDNHMVVGIASDDNLYLDCGYAYLDIMDYSFVGVPVNRLRGASKMYQDPVVFPVGSGTKIYHSGRETRYISDMAILADNRSGNLALKMKSLSQDTAENISEYNRVREDFFEYSRIYTYIVRHRFDRPGVYEYLQREMPA